MTSSVSFRPMVSNFAPSFKGNAAKDLKLALNELNQSSKRVRMDDISVMTQRMDLESKLNDTKVAVVKLVEDVKPAKHTPIREVGKNPYITAPTLESTVQKFQNGQIQSRVDRDAVLTDQMSQMAVNNRILHGLA